MTRRDLAWRLAGVVLLAAAGATSLIHRDVLAAAGNRPASAVEMGLALASFVLAGLGATLIVNGVRLRGAWRSGCAPANERDAKPTGSPGGTNAAHPTARRQHPSSERTTTA